MATSNFDSIMLLDKVAVMYTTNAIVGNMKFLILGLQINVRMYGFIPPASQTVLF